MSNLRDKILQAQDIQSELVYVKEWDTSILIKGLNGRQRAIVLQTAVDSKGKVDMQKLYPLLVVNSSFDPDTGERIFKDGDFDAVAEKSGAALETITQVAMRLSGFNNEEISKNSEEIQSADSISN